MPELKRIVLDVLKPHQPNVLELATAIAGLGADYRVSIDVIEVDEKTETVALEVEGERLDFDRIERSIRELGGTVHSIDKVLMAGDATSGA
jgi:hypothetical protein